LPRRGAVGVVAERRRVPANRLIPYDFTRVAPTWTIPTCAGDFARPRATIILRRREAGFVIAP
jgi:hypothetical protein